MIGTGENNSKQTKRKAARSKAESCLGEIHVDIFLPKKLRKKENTAFPLRFFYRVFGRFSAWRAQKQQGAAEKMKGKTTYICASSQNKVRPYFFFSAFLGVSRQGQGEFENTINKMECVSKKNHRVDVFFRVDFFDFFFLPNFLLRWLSASR
jgi:hypothetical protein